jgi:VanZ family protein
LLIASAIWVLSSQSILPHPKGVFGWDKLQHLLAYAVLAGTVGLWASPAFWKRRPVLALSVAALVSSAYGVIDEIHQYFVPGRNCNIWDWLADALGAGIGAAAVLAALRITEKRRVEKSESTQP